MIIRPLVAQEPAAVIVVSMKKVFTILPFLVSLCILSGGAALPVYAQANASVARSKIYPGSMCYPALFPDASNIVREITGVMNNHLPAEHTSIKVTCPIIRDAINTNGTRAVFVSVYRGEATTGPVECTLFSMGRFDEFIEMNSASFSGIGKTILSLDVDSSIPNGYYSIGCLIPNEYSGIFRYRVDEF